MGYFRLAEKKLRWDIFVWQKKSYDGVFSFGRKKRVMMGIFGNKTLIGEKMS